MSCQSEFNQEMGIKLADLCIGAVFPETRSVISDHPLAFTGHMATHRRQGLHPLRGHSGA